MTAFTRRELPMLPATVFGAEAAIIKELLAHYIRYACLTTEWCENRMVELVSAPPVIGGLSMRILSFRVPQKQQ